MLTLKTNERSDYDILSDRVTAAMETGNAAQARLVLKESEEAFPPRWPASAVKFKPTTAPDCKE